jgi:threonine synthase
MLVSRALALGAGRLVEDSSGNAGASMATYAARAGLPCTVYAPAAAPAPKLRAVLTAGAELRRVAGSREDVAAAALSDDRDGAYYAGHNTNPYFLHGMRSFADEVIQQFAGEPPEHILMPVGGGSLYVGSWLGLRAAHTAGGIARLPRLHIAQAAGCAPLVEAHRRGAADAVPVTRAPTIAGGITIERPARAPLILQALRESGGEAVAITEESILQVRRELATLEGLDVEPTSAVAFAALPRLRERGILGGSDRVLIPITGAGWKDPLDMGGEADA